VDRVTVAQVLAHGGGSRAANVVAAAGFTASGLSAATTQLRKDVGIMLARSTLASLGDPADA
jgi:hypothetical protein